MNFFKMVLKYLNNSFFLRYFTIGCIVFAFIIYVLYKIEKKARKLLETQLQLERMTNKSELKEKDEKLKKSKIYLEKIEADMEEMKKLLTVKETENKDEVNFRNFWPQEFLQMLMPDMKNNPEIENGNEFVQRIELWKKLSALYLENKDISKGVTEQTIIEEGGGGDTDKMNLIGSGDEVKVDDKKETDGQEKNVQEIVPSIIVEEFQDGFCTLNSESKIFVTDLKKDNQVIPDLTVSTLKRKKMKIKSPGFLMILRRLVRNRKELKSIQNNNDVMTTACNVAS